MLRVLSSTSLLLRWPVAMLVQLALASLGIALPCVGQRRPEEANAEVGLEIRLTSPVHWHNGCLQVNLNLANRTSSRLFLPNRGLDISTSVMGLPDDNGKKNGVEWINVYGLTDILDWQAKPLGPGETVHAQHCFGPTITAVNLQKKTRREVRLQGRLRIDAYYFLTAKDWLTSKAQHEAILEMTERELHRTTFQYPQSSRLIVTIPCLAAACSPDCEKPAVILHGEMRIVPDVFDDPAWIGRGQAINDKMARKSPACLRLKPLVSN